MAFSELEKWNIFYFLSLNIGQNSRKKIQHTKIIKIKSIHMGSMMQKVYHGSRFKILMISSVYLIAFQGPFGGLAIMTILPTLKQAFNIGVELIALTVTLYGIILGTTQFIAGPLSDRFGRKKILTIGLAFYIAGVGATIFVTDIWQYIFTRTIQAFGDGIVTPVITALAGDIVSDESRGRIMGGIGTIVSLALALGPLFGGFLASINWRWIFLSLFVLSFINLLLLLTVFRKVRSAQIENIEMGLIDSLKIAFKNKLILFLALLFMITGFGRLSLFTYLPDTLSGEPYNFNSVEIGYAMFLASLGGIFAAPIAGYMLDKIGRRKTVVLSFIVFLIALFSFLFFNLLLYWGYLTFYFGFSIAIFQTVIQTITADISSETRGTNMSLVMAVSFTGSSFAPILLVPVYSVYLLPGITAFCGLLLLFGFVAFIPLKNLIPEAKV